MDGWMESKKIDEAIDGWMYRKDKWMVECIVKNIKNSWMVGWTGKLEGWLDGYKKMYGSKEKWMDG